MVKHDAAGLFLEAMGTGQYRGLYRLYPSVVLTISGFTPFSIMSRLRSFSDQPKISVLNTRTGVIASKHITGSIA
jgi:hypothetical protein